MCFVACFTGLWKQLHFQGEDYNNCECVVFKSSVFVL